VRTLFFMALAAAVLVLLGSSLDLLHNHITWEEARGAIILSGLAALFLLAIYCAARKEITAHV
jgi:hypothetical protein